MGNYGSVVYGKHLPYISYGVEYGIMVSWYHRSPVVVWKGTYHTLGLYDIGELWKSTYHTLGLYDIGELWCGTWTTY